MVRVFLIVLLASASPIRGMQLKGAVTDSAGAAIANAMILIHWDSAGSTVGVADNIGIRADVIVRTKQDGAFTVELPPGFYDLLVAAPAFTPAARKVRLKTGKAQEIRGCLSPDPLYAAEMGDRVRADPPKP